MRFEPPSVVDFGSIARHTFTGDPGPSGKDPHGAPKVDKFDEPSDPNGLT